MCYSAFRAPADAGRGNVASAKPGESPAEASHSFAQRREVRTSPTPGANTCGAGQGELRRSGGDGAPMAPARDRRDGPRQRAVTGTGQARARPGVAEGSKVKARVSGRRLAREVRRSPAGNGISEHAHESSAQLGNREIKLRDCHGRALWAALAVTMGDGGVTITPTIVTAQSQTITKG